MPEPIPIRRGVAPLGDLDALTSITDAVESGLGLPEVVRAGSGWAVRIGAITVAIAAAVVVGLTRVYLRVHHLTDVFGGAAVGIALWALLGTLAVVVGHVRHNGSRAA